MEKHFFLLQATAYDVLLSEVKEQLGELNVHPIPTLDRVAIPSTIVIPRLLYRAERLPLTIEQLQRLIALIKSLVLAVKGLSPQVADKTTYSHRKIGLGVPYLLVVQPTGALDVIHKHPYMTSLRVGTSLPLARRMVYQTAVAHFKTATAPPQRPLDVYFQAKSLLPQSRGSQRILGLEVYEITNTKSFPAEGMVYTDGSKIGQPPSRGASAVAPSGTVYVCRAPGISCNYKAELLRILLGSHLCPHNWVIRVDCQGAISAVLSERRPMKEAYWVLAVRDSLRARNQSVVWVEGHSGEERNETADYFTKIPTQLPAPPATKSTGPWDLVVLAE